MEFLGVILGGWLAYLFGSALAQSLGSVAGGVSTELNHRANIRAAEQRAQEMRNLAAHHEAMAEQERKRRHDEYTKTRLASTIRKQGGERSG